MTSRTFEPESAAGTPGCCGFLGTDFAGARDGATAAGLAATGADALREGAAGAAARAGGAAGRAGAGAAARA
jgi:hypothetical protein